MRLAGTECGTVSVRWVGAGWKVVDVCRRWWYHVIGQARHLGERSLSGASVYSCAAIHFCCDYILHHTHSRHAGFPHRRQGRRRRRGSSDRRQATGKYYHCSPEEVLATSQLLTVDHRLNSRPYCCHLTSNLGASSTSTSLATSKPGQSCTCPPCPPLTPSLRHPVLPDPDQLQRAEMLRLR